MYLYSAMVNVNNSQTSSSSFHNVFCYFMTVINASYVYCMSNLSIWLLSQLVALSLGLPWHQCQEFLASVAGVGDQETN